jgi:hypothetical protein
MPDEAKIFEHLMQKRIENIEYWREIAIFEEGPFVFRVVQELQSALVDNAGARKAMRPNLPSRLEWICSSRESATEQALRCLQQSKNDNWIMPASASSAA